MWFLCLHFQGLCHQEEEWSFVTILNVLRGREGLSPIPRVSANAGLYLSLPFLSVLGLHRGPLFAPWGAGSRATGWWQKGEDGIRRSSDKTRGDDLSDWWAPQDRRRQRCFPLNVICDWPTEQVSHAGEALTALFLLPDSVITPISSLWRCVCRITITTAGMMPSSDFSSVLVATELFPLTGSQKSRAGKKWASWNSDWGFSTVHSQVMCWESHNHVLKRER